MPPPAGIVRFGPFELRPDAAQLFRHSEEIHLPGHPFVLLHLLVSNAGRVVSRDEICRALWPDGQQVEFELAINVAIRRIRIALEESTESPVYLHTVRGRGYRFDLPAQVEEAQPLPALTAPPSAPEVAVMLPPPAVSRSWRPKLSHVVLAVLVIGGVLATAMRLSVRRGGDPRPMEKLTQLGTIGQAAISPDGLRIAYIDQADDTLRVRSTAGGVAQVLCRRVGLVRKLVFSPDGGSLFFGAENGPTEGHRIFQISAGGGPPHAVVQGTAWLQQIVPGSNKILYLRAAEKDDVLYLSDSQGAHEQRILARLRPDRITAAEVSPDGKTIAFWWLVGNRNELHYALYTTNLGGTVETALGAEKWPVTYPRPELVWGPGGSELLVTSEEQQNRRQVYRVGYPAGGRERITDGLANYSSIRLTADGGTLFAVASERVEQIWTMDPRRPGSERLVTDRFPGLSQLVWSRDGRLVATGVGLWVVDPKTGATRQIPGTAAGDGYPSVTADGQSVLFASKRDGRSALWQVGLDGEHLQLIGEGVAPGRPKLARNGRWLVYSDFADDAISIWKRPLGPGQPAQRISFGDPATEPEVSPNGTQVLAVRPSRNLVVIYPIEGGPPVKTIALPGLAADLVAWSADGSAVHFLAPYEGVVNIWSQPIAGGQPQPVTRLPKPRVASFSWSPEGVLALARVQSSSDVAVIRGYSGADRPPGVLARIGWAASPH